MLKDWLSNEIGNILIIHSKMRRIESNLVDQIALVGRDL
jgi:hypothetical protein